MTDVLGEIRTDNLLNKNLESNSYTEEWVCVVFILKKKWAQVSACKMGRFPLPPLRPASYSNYRSDFLSTNIIPLFI
jgi:hypothetical protein